SCRYLAAGQGGRCRGGSQVARSGDLVMSPQIMLGPSFESWLERLGEPAGPGDAMEGKIQAPVLLPDDIPDPVGEGPSMLGPSLLWTIVPEMAKEILANHATMVEIRRAQQAGQTGQNRGIRQRDVDKYARDMRAYDWRRNGETLKWSWAGTWLDGQHRLLSCIDAATPFEVIVVFGVDPEDQATMDTGIKRQVHDQLHMNGEANANNLASIARWYWKWEQGGYTGSNSYGIANPSELEIVAIINRDPRIRAATQWARSAYLGYRKIAVRTFGMGWILFHTIDTVRANAFLEGVVSGAGLFPGHPA